MFHTDILDTKRHSLLTLIAQVGQGFYLAGGTALALQIGHRDSIDFDFFATGDIDTTALTERIEKVFVGHQVQKTQEEKNTLSVVIDNEVRLSFFGYHYPLLKETVDMDGICLASILDIGCMKLSAITGRSTLKDYVDLFIILKQLPLTELLASCSQKYPTLDHALILKSLVYFDDITPEPICFMPGFVVTSEEIESSLIAIVKDYLQSPK
ncbi:MAG: nucleotidyl transferase AbiEii/AbiGii toxin family protein [Candidatus Paceibacteria bacterium]